MFVLEINKQVIFAIKVLLLNLAGGLLACFGVRFGNIGRFSVLAFLMIVYIMVFCALRDREQQVWFLLLSIWQYTLMMETSYRMVRYALTPFETYYIFDVLGLIFLFMMFRECCHSLMSDILFLLLSVLLVLGTVSFAANGSSVIDYLHAIKLSVRYLGIYFFFSKCKFEFPKWSRYFLYASFLAFAAEVALGVNVDFRNGLFGYEYTGELLPTLLVVWSAGYLISFVEKRGHGRFFLFQFLLIEIMLVLMEAKAEVITYALWCALILLVKRSRGGEAKKIIAVAVVLISLSVAWRILLDVYPSFRSFLGNNFIEAILHRINSAYNKNSNVLFQFLDNEIDYGWQKFVGIGMGSAIPPRYVRWIQRSGLDASGLFNIIKFSALFTKDSSVFRFFNCAYDNIRTDLGYMGVIIFYVILVIALYRAVYICRHGKSFTSAVGAVGIWQCMMLVYRTVNGNLLIQHLPMAVTFAVCGVVFYEYRKLKECRRKEKITGEREETCG